MSGGVSGAVICPESAGTGALLLPPGAAGLAGVILAHLAGNSHLGPAAVCKGVFHCAGSIQIYLGNMDRKALMPVFESEKGFAAGRNHLDCLCSVKFPHFLLCCFLPLCAASFQSFFCTLNAIVFPDMCLRTFLLLPHHHNFR